MTYGTVPYFSGGVSPRGMNFVQVDYVEIISTVLLYTRTIVSLNSFLQDLQIDGIFGQ